MKWKGRTRSRNVEDRRGKSTGGKLIAGGGIIGLIFLAIQIFGGGDATEILNQIQQQSSSGITEDRELTTEELEILEFTEVVLADTERIWSDIFSQHGSGYREQDGTFYGCGEYRLRGSFSGIGTILLSRG